MKEKVSTEICLRGGVLGEGAVLSKNEVFFTKKVAGGCVFAACVFPVFNGTACRIFLHACTHGIA
jgi:hypothetical protein